VTAPRFVHPALFYRSDADYLRQLVPFVTDGLDRGEPVAAAVPGERLALLEHALGDAAERVRLLDMTDAGRNPGRIIPGVLRAFADAHPGRRVRIIGEPVWAGRTAVEYPACAQHEALINTAFTGRDVTIVCPYDTVALDPAALADAEATHPLLWESGRERPSPRYAPGAVVERYNLPLDPAPGAATCTTGSVAGIARARHFALDQARRRDLAADLAGDLELIVDELVTNSLLHARSAAELSIWTDLEHVVCQVSDRGRLTDPLAGRRPAAPGQLGGRGLLLVNAFADLVRTHTGDRGTTIRAYLRRRAPR
jgi:anti-sigma regulatory factor (Ser/Thr protein kinase)